MEAAYFMTVAGLTVTLMKNGGQSGVVTTVAMVLGSLLYDAATRGHP